MTAPRVVLLEAGGPESQAIVRTAAASGYQVHAVTTGETYAAYPPELTGLLAGRLLTDLADHDRSLADVIDYARSLNADALLTTNEYLTWLAAQACAALGLPGNDPNKADAARNKAAMAEAFIRNDVSFPRTTVVATELALRRLCDVGTLGFPCIVKPADAAGSDGVTILRNADDAARSWQAALSASGMYGRPRDHRVLVQKFVAGDEYSVESFTWQGRTTHVCLTRKIVGRGGHPIELGHTLPAELPPAVEAVVLREAGKAIAATGIRNGASHTEIKVSPDGDVAVIETGARLAAGHIGFLLQHALGIDPWAALLDIALGRRPALAPTIHEYATVRFFTSPCAGFLRSVSGLPVAGPRTPIVRLRAGIGDPVHAPTTNSRRLGCFVVTGTDLKAVEHQADTLLSRVRIEVAPYDNASKTAANAR